MATMEMDKLGPRGDLSLPKPIVAPEPAKASLHPAVYIA
jgi:hypothetical protein